MATLQENINQAINDFNNIKQAIIEKGVEVPAGTPTCDYGEKILNIETGVDVSADTVVAAALRAGFTAHEASGAQITGILDTEAIRAEGVEAGKKSEYDAFWDAYQENGFRDVYAYAFAGIGWTKKTFNPKYSIVPTNAFHLFQNSYANLNDIYTVLDEKGLVLDFSMCTIADSAFYGCHIEKLRRLDFTSLNSASDIFSYSARLHTIEALVIKETTKFYNLFVNCSVLTNLIIEGTIGQNGFNTSWSPLSKASLTSVINALSPTTAGLTVTVRASAVKKAFETSEGANDGDTSDEWLQLIATKPNWTINTIDS